MSDTTAATVTSEPVPAVVGMANSGAGGCLTLNLPSSAASCPPLVAIAAIIFDASIGDPPPSATTASQPSASYWRNPASTWANVGSGSTPAYSAQLHTGGLQLLGDPVDDADTDQARVGHHQHLADAAVADRPA